MQNFIFQCGTKILFGKGAEDNLPTEVSKLGKRVLLHHSGGHIVRSGLREKIMSLLNSAGVYIVELDGVKANPTLELVRRGVEICRSENIDCILAVGGGSVIDSAKAIGIAACSGRDVWDYFSGAAVPSGMLPLGVVLTIPATGSEAGDTTVITNEADHSKRALAHPSLRPSFAIMNPEHTFSLPAYQTAVGGIDIMSHVFERYFTSEQDVDFTDRLCEATIKTVIRNLPIAVAKPDDYAARAELMWAGTIAHNGLLGTGRTEDWASHMMGHELSAIYDIAHGASLSIVIPQWMRYVYKDHIERFYQFAVRVWELPESADKVEIAGAGIERTKEFFRSVGAPVSFSDAGLDAEQIEEMARKCCAGGPIGGIRKLNEADVTEIYKKSL